MKKTIKLNEEDIRNLVTEVINEMSPEFLAHAARVANKKGRTVQGKKFGDYAAQTFNKMYDVDPKKSDEAMYYMNPPTDGEYDRTAKFPTNDGKPFQGRFSTDYDLSNEWGAINQKAAIRNKIANGERTAKHMNIGADPNGNPYPDEFENIPNNPEDLVNEAIVKAIKKILK